MPLPVLRRPAASAPKKKRRIYKAYPEEETRCVYKARHYEETNSFYPEEKTRYVFKVGSFIEVRVPAAPGTPT